MVGAAAVQPYLTPVVMADLTGVGGIIIMDIGCNMLEITKIRLANMIPALVFAVAALLFWGA